MGAREGNELVWPRWSRVESGWCASSLDDSLEAICGQTPWTAL